MGKISRFGQRWGAPASAGVFFVLWCVGEAGRMGGSFLNWPSAPSLIALTVALGVSARFPVISMAVTGALLAGQVLHLVPPINSDWPIYLGAAYSMLFIALNARPKVQWSALALAPVCTAVMAFLMLSRQHSSGVGWFYIDGSMSRGYMAGYWVLCASFLLVMMVPFWLAGYVVRGYNERGTLFRERAAAVEDLRATEVDLIIEQERTRISRDLHDVLAHSLAVIVAQADGSRYLSKDQSKPVLAALENIAASARGALRDAQRVIEGVSGENSAQPQPALGDVDALVERLNSGSLAVERSASGTPVELGPGQELAVFRIIQESLTNALKHGGPGTRVTLHLDWSGPGLSVQVASHAGTVAPDPERTGRGIPGMRERAHLAGGWLTAGPDGETFRVTAFVPYGLQPFAADSVVLQGIVENANA